MRRAPTVASLASIEILIPDLPHADLTTLEDRAKTLDASGETRFAAALARDGDVDAAQRELAGTSSTPDELALLPGWAGTALTEHALLAR